MREKLLLIGVFVLTVGWSQLLWADEAYTIYPRPHLQTLVDGNVDLSSAVNVICDEQIDSYTRSRLEEILQANGRTWVYSDEKSSNLTNVLLSVSGSNGVADRLSSDCMINRDNDTVQSKFDYHLIQVKQESTSGMLLIKGVHTNAVFFGLASIEQIMEQQSNGQLRSVKITDYSDLQYRGIVEGYYGYPYSFEVKKDLMHFFKRYKMNTYLYGAKSDPYHSGFWRNPYPVTVTPEQEARGWLSQDMMKALAKESKETKVNFIWAIHPGAANAVNFSTESSTQTGVNDVFKKFQLMYDLGIRQFAVFLDDVGWNLGQVNNYASFLTNLQKKIEDTYNKDYANPADTVMPIHYVPHIYAISFANETDRTNYFNAIAKTPSQIVVYTTGWGVWSRPAESDFQIMKKHMGRPVSMWWNYPCNDNQDSKLYTTDMYTTLDEMGIGHPDKNIPSSLGLVSNPMQEGEVAKITLFGVADYSWNTSGFDPKKNWNASFKAIVGEEKARAYQYVSLFLRREEPAYISQLITKYKSSLSLGKPDGVELQSKMDSLLWACDIMKSLRNSENESDRLLYHDMRPWLLKLDGMATSIQRFLVARGEQGLESRWNKYVEGSISSDSVAAKSHYVYTLEGMGENPPVGTYLTTPSNRYFPDFVNYLNKQAFTDFFKVKTIKTNPTFITNQETPVDVSLYSEALTGNIFFVTRSECLLEQGDFIGIQLPEPRLILDMQVADSLYEQFVPQYSVDGKHWTTIHKGDAAYNGFLYYFRILNLSDKVLPLHVTKDVFRVKVPVETKVASIEVPAGDIYDNHTKEKLTDGDYSTYFCLNKNQSQGETYVLKLSQTTPINDVRVCVGTVNGDYMNTANVQISKDGNSWSNIAVKGTRTADFSMDMPQVVKYSDEMSYCDFDGKGANARYVRFYNKSPRTNKWLRLYEMEVNKQSYEASFLASASDNKDQSIRTMDDGLPYTKYVADNTGYIVYQFLNATDLKTVQVYQDMRTSTVAGGVIVTVSRDGEEWLPIGNLELGVTTFDMGEYQDVRYMRFEWKNEPYPVIYQIIESGEKIGGKVTSIERVEGEANDCKLTIDQNGALHIYSPKEIAEVGLYDPLGLFIMKCVVNNENNVILPQISSPVVIVRISMKDGTKATYKTSVK